MTARLLALAAALAVAAPGRADLVTLGVPAEYTPGTPFAVDVGLTPVTNLGLYNVELVFRSPGAAPGWLDLAAPVTAAGSGYVFVAPDNFLGNWAVVGSEYRLTLSDFTLDPTGPDVAAGVNDRLSSVLVRPSADLTTPIEVGIDRTSLFVDDTNGDSLLGTGPLPSVTIAPTAVPAPAGLACGLIAVGVLLARRRRAHTPAAAPPSGVSA